MRKHKNHQRKYKFLSPILLLAIFTIAIALRVPACHESFWVDELHTTWCVWDSLGDVASRAALGNQTPVYYWGIWFWKLVGGESEIALRMSSVVATSMTAAICAWAVLRRTESVVASLVTGLILAIESNAIFYGTELRPYAWVMLAMAIWLALDASEIRYRVILQVCVAIIAIAVQPTAIIALAILSMTFVIRLRDRPQWIALAVPICIGLVCLGLASIMASLTWQNREMWSSFAKLRSWQDVMAIWNWPWLALGPAIVTVVWGWRRRHEPEFQKAISYFVVVIAMTLVVALASAWDWVHLWHRRYMIAALPLMATAAGLAIAQVRHHKLAFESVRFPIVQTAIGFGLVLGLTYSQGTLPIVWQSVLNRQPCVLAGRGEDWRSAAQWINANTSGDETIGIDSGLIEADRYLGPRSSKVKQGAKVKMSGEIVDYLCYPVLSCYRVDRPVRPVRIADHTITLARTFVARYPIGAMNSVASEKDSLMAFGNLTILQKPEPNSASNEAAKE